MRSEEKLTPITALKILYFGSVNFLLYELLSYQFCYLECEASLKQGTSQNDLHFKFLVMLDMIIVL